MTFTFVCSGSVCRPWPRSLAVAMWAAVRAPVMAMVVSLSLGLGAGGCGMEAVDAEPVGGAEPTGQVVSALNPPPIPTPAGYGHYCSMRYPPGPGWAFATITGATSDPCGWLRRQTPGGTIERAGLWAQEGENNVMVRCTGDLRIYRAFGSQATAIAYDDAAGKSSCVFTVAPVALPIFNRPYGKTTLAQINPDSDVGFGRGFNFNLVQVDGTNVSMFGQPPVAGHPDAHVINRHGQQLCHIGTADECAPNPAGCHVNWGAHEGIDWGMPAGKPILAVADGIVREARDRPVGCSRVAQKEIYIEHQVGSGTYAENFITYYAHMRSYSVKVNDIVTRGQKIGEAGTTGCSGGNHLHFGVLRVTNLSGYRTMPFVPLLSGWGFQDPHGYIDPYAWAAPQHVDPWAWRFLGTQPDPATGGTLTDPGAFSINMWNVGPPAP